ncbi:MAG: hypothetical protein IJP13_05160 [Lachnospiraceae bacterium]|nr:hypothetical protein [Lachnospiraceae bacterium]
MKQLPPMTQLDYMVSSNESLMLKALLPFIPKDFQPFLATYIKYSELMATIELFSGRKTNSFSNFDNDDSSIISCLLPYIPEEHRQTLEMFENLQNTMSMYDEYKDLFTSSFEESSDCDNGANTDNSTGMDMNMEMFDMLQAFMNNTNT